MKLTLPDGSVLEGGSEEFRQVGRGTTPLVPSPPVFVRYEHAPECMVVTASRGWWSVVPPRCTCGLIRCPEPATESFTWPGTVLDAQERLRELLSRS